jgi:transketolase
MMMKNPLERCRHYRRKILDISQQVSALHIAPAFSCTEIVDVVMNETMRLADPSDIFLMSKGHGCMILYVILAERGLLSEDDLRDYCTPSGRLGAHPDFGVPGIAASTGSLGHGLAIAAGQAYAEKLKQSDVRTFCVISDGELQEGSTWEAIMMASNLRLANLTMIVDNNDFSGLERMSTGHPAVYPVAEKLVSFGWTATECDGHDHSELRSALTTGDGRRPHAVVASTVKGRGVSYMENENLWHYRSPNKTEYAQALRELGFVPS